MSDHDNQQHTPDSGNDKDVKTAQNAASEVDETITEEAISQVLRKEGSDDQSARPGEKGPETQTSDAEATDDDGIKPDAVEPSEIDADDITLAEAAMSDEEPLPEDESQDPVPSESSMQGGQEPVTVTVNRLQELGDLLKELNFREMIMRFGELQAELDVLRDGVRQLKSLALSPDAGNTTESEVDVTATLQEAADQMKVAAEQLASFSAWKGDGQQNCIELASQVMDSLETLKQSHTARLAMAADLSDMVESDASNEQLASAALEFAVFLREIDAAQDLEAFEIAFAELKALHGDMKNLSTDGESVDQLVENLNRQSDEVRDVSEKVSSLRRFHQAGREILMGLAVNGNGGDTSEGSQSDLEHESARAETAQESETE